jgi:hypothetical protein
MEHSDRYLCINPGIIWFQDLEVVRNCVKNSAFSWRPEYKFLILLCVFDRLSISPVCTASRHYMLLYPDLLQLADLCILATFLRRVDMGHNVQPRL